MAGFMDDRFWMVLPYELLKDHPELMIWPAAIKDERDRKPRLLCDHSWDWGWPSLNDTTLPHAPPEAMQFGGTLKRIMTHTRRANPKFGPPRLGKTDCKDGFYRLYLRAQDLLHLALLLPRYEGEPQLIGIPMSCTMGWTESPPTFSVMSETVCDDANKQFRIAPLDSPPHRLEPMAAPMDDLDRSMIPRPRGEDQAKADLALAGTLPSKGPGSPVSNEIAPPSNRLRKRPLGETDVFVDDFIQIGQGGKRRMLALRRHLFHAIDRILAQPDVSPQKRNEAISLKKLLKGDSSWSTRKVILGWLLDTIRQTIELPAHRKLELAQLFHELASKSRVTEKYWLKVLGKLRFISVAIPGSAGLFSALQLALQRSSHGRIRVTRALRHHIDAFASLAADLSHRPTHLAEIIPEAPKLLGTTDAAKAGMGGVYYDPDGNCYLWRQPFSPAVQARLVSADNPHGDITNSDLEHAGLLAQVSLMATTHDVRYATLVNGCDNTPAVSRTAKGAITSDGAGARLCNYACAHQRQERYCHVAFYFPGDANVMADDASRLQHLTDSQFLAHFEQHYPQPRPWQMLHLPSELNSWIHSALLSTTPATPVLTSTLAPSRAPSVTGPSSARASARTHSSVMSKEWMPSSRISWSTEYSIASKGAPTTLSDLTPWLMSWEKSPRGSPTWVETIRSDRTAGPKDTIPYSLICSRTSRTKTTLPAESTLVTCPSSGNSLKLSTPNIPSTAPSTKPSSI